MNDYFVVQLKLTIKIENSMTFHINNHNHQLLNFVL